MKKGWIAALAAVVLAGSRRRRTGCLELGGLAALPRRARRRAGRRGLRATGTAPR